VWRDEIDSAYLKGFKRLFLARDSISIEAPSMREPPKKSLPKRLTNHFSISTFANPNVWVKNKKYAGRGRFFDLCPHLKSQFL
jgi:hypothetical protein